MSKLVLVLLATSAGLGLLSLFLVNQVRVGDAAIVELQTKVTALEEQLRKANSPGPFSRFVVEPAVPSAGPPPPSGLPVAPLKERAQGYFSKVPRGDGAQPSEPSREAMMRAFRESREQRRQLMEDPEYRAAMRLQTRANFVRQYPGVVQELGLDPQQANEFFDLLADQQQRATDGVEALWDMDGMDPAAQQEQRQKLQQRAMDLQRQQDAELSAKFGQDTLQAWKQYQSTLGARYQVEQMRGSLSAQGIPLSDDASKSMLRALADAQKAETDQMSAAISRGAAPGLMMLGPGQMSQEDVEQQIEASRKRSQRTLDAMSPYLTSQQRQVIEREQEAQLKLQEAHMRVQRRQSVAGRAGFISDP